MRTSRNSQSMDETTAWEDSLLSWARTLIFCFEWALCSHTHWVPGRGFGSQCELFSRYSSENGIQLKFFFFDSPLHPPLPSIWQVCHNKHFISKKLELHSDWLRGWLECFNQWSRRKARSLKQCLIFLTLNQKVLEKIVQTVMHNDTDICCL